MHEQKKALMLAYDIVSDEKDTPQEIITTTGSNSMMGRGAPSEGGFAGKASAGTAI